ncbi:hypothetical protein [Nitratireductor basaltis]|uniref:Uncharacterized protein n=1 Tax=Nitratireductor basaltis TaxID=472175 RepID=A0A084U7Q9_9HYPH|nr:hypothetical protein [Nitratireductor basaltis]KFB08995.1 hypothetical protein EL18_00009 [Nitratireductor basaltis]
MPSSRYLIASSIIGALALAAAAGAFAFNRQDIGKSVPAGELLVVIKAGETDNGICLPEALVSVNKQEQGLYALYGEARYIDTRNDESTRLPLQWVFMGWDDNGMSKSQTTTGINTQTPCTSLKIAYRIKECWYDPSNREPRACPKIHLEGDGFAAIVLDEDQSQSLPQAESGG